MGIMRISFITSYYGTGIGGSDISTKLLVDGLINKGFNINIINLSTSFLTLKRFLLNTNIYDFFLKKHIKKQVIASERSEFARSYQNTDLIHVHDLMLLPASVKVAKQLNIPIIVTVRDYRFISNLPILEVENNLIKKINKKEYIKLLKKKNKFTYII